MRVPSRKALGILALHMLCNVLGKMENTILLDTIFSAVGAGAAEIKEAQPLARTPTPGPVIDKKDNRVESRR